MATPILNYYVQEFTTESDLLVFSYTDTIHTITLKYSSSQEGELSSQEFTPGMLEKSLVAQGSNYYSLKLSFMYGDGDSVFLEEQKQYSIIVNGKESNQIKIKNFQMGDPNYIPIEQRVYMNNLVFSNNISGLIWYRIIIKDSNDMIIEDSKRIDSFDRYVYNLKTNWLLYPQGNYYAEGYFNIAKNYIVKSLGTIINQIEDVTSEYQDKVQLQSIEMKNNNAIRTFKVQIPPPLSTYQTYLFKNNNLISRGIIEGDTVKGYQIIFNDLNVAENFNSQNYTIILSQYWYNSTSPNKIAGAEKIIVPISVSVMNDYNIEDIFLSDKDNVLRIRFNPEISSYKHVVQESFTQTLGSKYPYYKRNGNLEYRQFNIGGLISYEAHIGLEKGLAQMVDLTQNWVADEKEFRNCVLDFLYQPSARLFRSPTEDIMIVQLSTINLTPNKQLGRAIYSFTATVTEIAENTYDNYIKYGLLEVSN